MKLLKPHSFPNENEKTNQSKDDNKNDNAVYENDKTNKTKDDNDNNNIDDNDNDNFAFDDEKTIWTQVTRMAMVKGLGVLTEVQVTEVNITETR